ncbi:hypothetical protein MMC08_003911 [Hypocenomyce scalaris]|nr:hypothetical protein [Hypocenomyce scalaris]
MQEPLLSELCKICHINPPKYRCPRCSTQTCSLPCTKRHKLWAQCNGVRDPALYKKKADLATPGGIDHDYNFLTSLERKLGKADRETEERGIVLQAEANGGYKNQRNGPMKGEVNVQKALERMGVVVDRAPKGMTRSKENLTHWHKKHRCVVWSVEWIHDDGSKELGTCLETLPLSEAYARHLQEKQPASKKRKLASGPYSEPKPNAAPANTGDVQSPPEASKEHVTSSDPPRITPQSSPPAEDLAQAAVPPSPVPLASTGHAASSTTSHFYLLRPHTPSASRVLIPLLPTSTLSTSLNHRVILEFPTIYILPYLPDALPEGFMLEEQFLGYSEKENRELEALLKEVVMPGDSPREDDSMRDQAVRGEEKLNDRKILDVLRQDLDGLQEQS